MLDFFFARGEALEQQTKTCISVREREIAQLVAHELKDKEIAQRLQISHRTVRFHIQSLQIKLGVASRVGIAVWIVTEGIDKLG